MEDRERWLILFREMVLEKILDEQLDLEYPRASFLKITIEFREKYGFSLFSKFSYFALAKEFLGALGQYISVFDFDKLKKKMIPKKKRSSASSPVSLLPRSSWGDYHENRAP